MNEEIKVNNEKILIKSAEMGNIETVNMLIELGTDIHSENDKALKLAWKNGHKDIINILIENGAEINNVIVNKGEDEWGREIYFDTVKDKTYKDVDGILHTVTYWGEPAFPIGFSINENNFIKNIEIQRTEKISKEKNMESVKTVDASVKLENGENNSLEILKKELNGMSLDGLSHRFGEVLLKQQELIDQYKEAIIVNNDKYKVLGDETLAPEVKKNLEQELSKEAFITYAKNHSEFRDEFVVIKEKFKLEELKDQLKTMQPEKVAELFEEKRIAQNKIVNGFKENIKEYYPDKSDKELDKVAFAKYCNNEKYMVFRDEFVEVKNKHAQHENIKNLDQLKTDLKTMNVDQVKDRLDGRKEIQSKIIDAYKVNIKKSCDKKGKEINDEALEKQAFAKFMSEPKYDQLKKEYKAISGRLKELEKTEEQTVEKDNGPEK